MTVSTEKGNKDEAGNACPFAGPQQIELSVPVGDINAVGVRGAAGGCVDDGIDTIEGVVEAVGLQQIPASELATPFLQKRRFARRSHHAADLMTGIKRIPSDLPAQRARATHHKNLHGAQHSRWELNGPAEGPDVAQSP